MFASGTGDESEACKSSNAKQQGKTKYKILLCLIKHLYLTALRVNGVSVQSDETI